MRLFQEIFSLLQQPVYLLDQGMKFFGILFYGSLGTEFHPVFFLFVLHRVASNFQEVRIEILVRE